MNKHKKSDLKILVIGTHQYSRQPSMKLFSEWLEAALSAKYQVSNLRAPSLFLNALTRRLSFSKWLGYIDQYIILTIMLWLAHRRFQYILFADHSNAISGSFVPSNKIAVMVHDTIAIRQARGEIDGAPIVARSGHLLQSMILSSIRRATIILRNPGNLGEQLVELGIKTKSFEVGCPVDLDRLANTVAPTTVPSGPFLLNVGSDGWRKRKNDLLQLMSALSMSYPALTLVLAGFTETATVDEIDRLGLGSKVIILNDVSDGQLAWLYAHCSATVTAAHEEGFCIPVVEALSFGKLVFVPVDAPIYRLIFGGAVIGIDLSQPITAALAVKNKLSEPNDADLRRAEGQLWSMGQFQSRVVAAFAAS